MSPLCFARREKKRIRFGSYHKTGKNMEEASAGLGVSGSLRVSRCLYSLRGSLELELFEQTKEVHSKEKG